MDFLELERTTTEVMDGKQCQGKRELEETS